MFLRLTALHARSVLLTRTAPEVGDDKFVRVQTVTGTDTPRCDRQVCSMARLDPAEVLNPGTGHRWCLGRADPNSYCGNQTLFQPAIRDSRFRHPRREGQFLKNHFQYRIRADATRVRLASV